MELLCFRLYPSAEYNPEYLNAEEITWLLGSAEYLSYLFQLQILRNESLFEELSQRYFDDPYALELHRLRSDESTYPLYLQKRKEKRSPLADAYTTLIEDLLPMDESVLYQEGYNTAVYAMVLVSQGRYLGHIYAWISPSGKLLFAMGIRKSIELILENNKDIAIAPYLFEGIRMLALSLGLLSFSIVSPYPHVARMLESLGFKEQNVKYSDIGISPSYYDIDQYEFVSDELRDVFTLNNLTLKLSPGYANILIQHN